MNKWIVYFLIFIGLSLPSIAYHKTTTLDGINLIKSFESCKLVAYKCPASVWTIGVGNTSHARPGLVITKDIAIRYLQEDLKRFEKPVNANSKRDLKDHQFDAIISLTFNCGYIFSKNLASAVNNNQTEVACNNILSHCHAWIKQKDGTKKFVEMWGLKRRRIAEVVLYKK